MKKLLTVIICLVLTLAVIFPAAALSTVAVKGIALDKSTLSLNAGETYTLKVTFSPANTTQKLLKFATSNVNVAKVDTTGKITAVSGGTADITAVSTADGKVTAKCTVTVAAKAKFPAKITLVSVTSIGGSPATPESIAALSAAVKKATGVTLEIINNQQGDVLVATKIAAGETVDLYNGQLGQLRTQKALVPIQQKWIDESTNLKQIPQMFWRNFKETDKSTFAIPFRSMMRSVMLIRQDWLDKLKLKAPTTMDEYYNVTKAFAMNDPDGNGKNDTYGYSASNQWNSIAYFFYPIQGALCKYEGEYAFDTATKKLIYEPFQPDYKTYLQYLQKSYREKIIDPEIFTNQHANMVNNFESGKTGIIVYFIGNLDEIVAKTKAVNPNANIVPIAPPSGPAGKGFYAVTSANGWGIIKGCKDPEGVCAFVDWITGNEGQQLLCYGPEGFNYKMENGVAKVTTQNSVTFGLDPNLVILQNQFKPILTPSQIVQDSLKINDANLKFDNSVTRPNNPQASQEGDLFQEYYCKIVSGQASVTLGMDAWRKAFQAKGLQKYYDDANKDTSWFGEN